MHSDAKKRRSFVALLFVAGDLRCSAQENNARRNQCRQVTALNPLLNPAGITMLRASQAQTLCGLKDITAYSRLRPFLLSQKTFDIL
jgi:hypothetical protein